MQSPPDAQREAISSSKPLLDAVAETFTGVV